MIVGRPFKLVRVSLILAGAMGGAPELRNCGGTPRFIYSLLFIDFYLNARAGTLSVTQRRHVCYLILVPYPEISTVTCTSVGHLPSNPHLSHASQ